MVGQLQAQKFENVARGRALDMLQQVSTGVRKHYYDPKFHGLDWDAETAEARQRVEQSASFNAARSEIAALLGGLDDSHTVFLPPRARLLP